MNRPKNSDDNSKPPQRERAGMDPQERRLWDLDDGDDLLDEAADDLPDSEDESPEAKDGTTPDPDLDKAPESADEEIESDSPASDEDSPDEGAPKKRTRRESRGKSQDESPPPIEEGNPASTSKIEKISLAVFGALILGLVVWGLVFFLHELPTDDPARSADFPVEGKNLTVASIDTYWRKPDLDKDRGVKAAARAIPAGLLTLAESKGSGALRVFFEDEENNLMGDPVTVAVTNGKFEHNKSSSFEIFGTEGFNDEGDLPAYLTGQIELWSMIVKEGPSTRARGNEFKEILRLPIQATRR